MIDFYALVLMTMFLVTPILLAVIFLVTPIVVFYGSIFHFFQTISRKLS